MINGILWRQRTGRPGRIFRSTKGRTRPATTASSGGLPVRLSLSEGQAYDGHQAMPLLSGLPENAVVLADRAYDADAIRPLNRGQNVFPIYRPCRSAAAGQVSPSTSANAQSGRVVLQKAKTFQSCKHSLWEGSPQLHDRCQTRMSPDLDQI
ncbi:transposase [Roseibium litorale]|uniref:transposase n=1 Tax=Roseibium litorale TaxID=2803841 RepID=UPI003CCCA7D3